MLPSHKRLTGKDVQYWLRRGKKLYGSTFVCVVFDQYPNRKRHQASIQIPVKLDKRATTRNRLKKVAMSVFQEELLKIKHQYKKRFIFVNKKHIASMVDVLATSSKTTIVKERRERCKKDFSIFISHYSWNNQWKRSSIRQKTY